MQLRFHSYRKSRTSMRIAADELSSRQKTGFEFSQAGLSITHLVNKNAPGVFTPDASHSLNASELGHFYFHNGGVAVGEGDTGYNLVIGVERSSNTQATANRF